MVLKVGDKAPNFRSENQNGEIIKLSDFLGKKIILYFYPKDDTPGCTKEACNFRDNINVLAQHGWMVMGVSINGSASHEKFAKKYALPFDLMVDEDKKIVEKYGVWVEKSMYGKKYFGTARVTFLIDERGYIQHIIEKVNTSGATEQILNLLKLV